MQEMIRNKALELLKAGKADRVLAWRRGAFCYDVTPALFTDPEQLQKELVFDLFCAPNLSKSLIAESKKPGKTAVFLKSCDSYSLAQLCKEHRVDREKVYAVGVECHGTCDGESLRAAGITAPLRARAEGETLVVDTLYGEKTVSKQDALLERCRCCKSSRLVDCDEILGRQGEEHDSARFDDVRRLQAMTARERYDFWQTELSRCIRCNACRNACPACSCEKCVFDNPASGVENKGAANSFEEQLFHIIRAFHVAGRCTDCGECSRVCPQHIPLHLLNRKLILDANELYGDYQAGADPDSRPPMMAFSPDDPEPDVIYGRTQP